MTPRTPAERHLEAIRDLFKQRGTIMWSGTPTIEYVKLALADLDARTEKLSVLLPLASPAALEGETPAERTLKSIATMLGWENVPPQRTLEMEVAALKARALATPPAPPAPELDFVNAQTPLEPEARAILNRNRAELYLGPPAPVATYDANFGNDKVCACGHTYFRHFDTYDGMRPVGCKYCDCVIWRRPDEGRR